MAENTFDYIIAGGGMAGLSLAFYLNESVLRDKKILIVDLEAKTANDHTWCFWETGASAFNEIVFRRWQGVRFHGTNRFSALLDLGEYVYKMIRAEDFYSFVRAKLETNPNFTFLQADILEVFSSENRAVVKTDKGEFFARDFVFDSFTRKTYDNPKYQNLWQHFTGWTIETDRKVFKPVEPTLFDFRVRQKDECRFFYVLPYSENKALVEFTVFSDNFLEKGEYEFYLREYIVETLRIENYEITETETGVIPMSDEPHEQFPAPKIVRIGTAGGYVKPSTGYSFQRTQRRLQKIVAELVKSDSGKFRIPHSALSIWKNYLDSVLLNVLKSKKHAADDVFTRLFRQNAPPQVLKFLDEDTSFQEDFAIMKTVPLAPFARAALQTAAKKLFNK